MLGTLLIQPQALARMQGRSAAEELADEVVALAQKLIASPQQAQALAPVATAALNAVSARLLVRWQPRLPAITAELLAMLAPIVDPLRGLSQGDAIRSPAALLRRLADLLEGLDGLPAALSDAGITAQVQRVSVFLTGTLGLDRDLLAEELRATLDALRTGIEARLPELDRETRATAAALACLIARVETMLSQMPQLDVDTARIAGLLIGSLRTSGFAEVRDRVACITGKLVALLRAAADVLAVAEAAATRSGSVPARAARRPAPAPARTAVAAASARAVATARRHASRDAPGGSGAPPRSADGTFCWYASWLYAERRQDWYEDIVPGYPEDEVWLTQDRKCLVLRRANHDDEVLHRSDTPFEWHQAPPFSAARAGERFSFGVFPPEFLEVWARAGTATVETGKGIWHLVDMMAGKRKHGANAPLWLWYWVKAVYAGAGAPLPSQTMKDAQAGLGLKFFFTPFPAWLAVIFGSIEGHHSETDFGNKFLYWATLLGSNALTAFAADSLLYGIHDATLSLFTLINQEGESAGVTAANWEHGQPVIGWVTFLALYFMVKAKSRDDYSHLFSWKLNPWQALWFFLLSPLVGASGGAVGTLVVWAFARHADAAQLGREIGYGALRGLRDFYLYEYMFKEGDTDDGRYNTTLDPKGNTYPGPYNQQPLREPFTGYPPAGTSPYRLPYEKDRTLFVGQANLGTFSHMRFNWIPQVYAYDFAHDFGDEVLCSRDGTVVDYFDWITNDIEPNAAQMMAAVREAIGWPAASADPTAAQLALQGLAPACLLVNGQSALSTASTAADGSTITDFGFNWNFVLIRHDTQDADHDKDQRGTVVTTFAQYGHGAKGSVRAAFAARGIADPRQIIGQPVQRGQVIMKAGDTGTSFHNHLHMHVLSAGATSGAAVPPPVRSDALRPYTIPFVFGEATNLLGRDGVLKRLTWYTSDNPKI